MENLIIAIILASSITLNIFFYRNWNGLCFMQKPIEYIRYLFKRNNHDFSMDEMEEDEIDWDAYKKCCDDITEENKTRNRKLRKEYSAWGK